MLLPNILCHQQDILAVSAADNSISADVYTIRYDTSGNGRAFFDLSAGHKDGINDFGAMADICAREQDRAGDFPFDIAALGDIGDVHLRVRTDVLRLFRSVFGVNDPAVVVQVEFVGFGKKIHIGFPEGLHSTYILPVTLELISDQALAAVQHDRDDILAEIMMGIGIFHICDQYLAQRFPVEDVDTHGSKIALRMLGLFFELDDPVLLIGIHDTETAGFLHRDADNGDRGVGLVCLVEVEHFVVIHLVDVVARKDQQILGIVSVDKVDILGNGIGCATVHA